MGHTHLHRRGEHAPLMEREETHEHQPRSPQFWEDVGDAWNRFIGKDEEEEEEPTSTRRSTGPSTIVRTVYQTLTPSFTGSVGGYRTVSDSDDEDEKPTSTKKAAETTTFAAGGPVLGSARPTTTAEEESTEKIPTVISQPTKSKIESTLAVATSTPSAVLDPTGTVVSADRADASISSASSTSIATTENAETGPSTGAKAGIAIGVLAGLLFIGLLAFWLFNRRKKQIEQDQNARDDEKLNPFGNPALVTAAAVPSSNSQRSGPAPRLSLRPVTQFLPNLSLDKRNSKGAQVMLASGPSGGDDRLAPNHARNSWDRPNTGDSTNPSNPFGNQAERIPTPIMEEPESPYPPSEKPLPAGPTTMAAVPSAQAPAPAANNANGMGMAAGVAAGAAAGAVAAGALTRKASIRQDGGPKPLDLTLPPPPSVGAMVGPPSPAGTEFSETSQSGEQPAPSSSGAAAIAAAGGPANSMVHRVQLDFKPTMDDELELRAGQLVRLLHEYDDGWALCIRLDRSQQGVVPRTCLSTRPVKPRPQNGPGPNGPGPNGPGPRNHPGRPNGPGGPPRGPGPKFGPGQRPQGGPHGGPRGGPQFAGGPNPAMMHGRPASPGGRAMSPGPRAQSPGPRFQGPPGGRPQSPSGMGPRSQSPGPRFQGPPGGRPQSPSGMGPRSQSPAGHSRIPQPSRMGPGGSPPQGSPMSPVNGRTRAASSASNASGPPTGPVARKPVPGSAY
ncbi:variant SH3 domain-containing protein [Plectosphaerella cucumerina]|uniref:Variant SH3 domain-containing protein n=1 Tax=Plectosphaerella cucumerina TaxID=40658 RepID=A0A8K0X035_9PEZI|nr:variant SH3 domain-containing protein [Plectosphaerella cucumerina]